MSDPTTNPGALTPLSLQRLGEMLRGQYLLPATLPSGMYDLVTRLDRSEAGAPGGANHDEQSVVPASKEGDYLQHAAEATRLAQRATSWSDRTRLVRLATAWLDLAKKARERRE
jgi:hypothetical protein